MSLCYKVTNHGMDYDIKYNPTEIYKKKLLLCPKVLWYFYKAFYPTPNPYLSVLVDID